MRFLRYVLKSLWGHRTRSLLTVGGAAVSLFVFTFVGGVRGGMDQISSGWNERSLIVFQIHRFCPETSRLPEAYGKTIAALPGVADVLPMRVFMNNCGATLDLIVLHGVPPQKLRAFRDLSLVAGSFSEFETRRDAALVGRTVADRRRLRVGDKFTVGELTVTVAGVFSASNPAVENTIYTPLEFLQYGRGLNSVGMVTQFEVKVADGADPVAVARAIDESFRADRVQTDTRAKGVFESFAVGDLAELVGLAGYLGYACIVLVLTLVSSTTMMTVQDRAREYAVLQTIGISWDGVFRLVLAESAVLGGLGGALGVTAAAAVLNWGGLSLATEGVSVAFSASGGLVAIGLTVAMVIGLAAGVFPAWQAARSDIVEALRSS